MAQWGGKNDSLSQVDEFLDDPTVALCPAWYGAVSEFLGTREEHRRSKSRGIDGNVDWAAVNLLHGNQGQGPRGHLNRCRCGKQMTMTGNSMSITPIPASLLPLNLPPPP